MAPRNFNGAPDWSWVEGFMDHIRKHGPEATARFMIRELPTGTSLGARKRGAIFITAFLGHRIRNWCPEFRV